MQLITLASLNADHRDLIRNGVMCHFVDSIKLHTHDFYEFTLVTSGMAHSEVNGQQSVLQAGQLQLLRPGDVHFKKKLPGCHMISLGFSAEVFDALLIYLGENFDKQILYRHLLPPIVILSDYDLVYFSHKIEALYQEFVRKEVVADFELRIILLEFIVRIIPHLLSVSISPMPEWFSVLLQQMREPVLFVEGLSALQRLSGKSQSSLCKAFNKYLNISPTQYLNQLRIEYAAQLLTATTKSVLTIAYECGYETVSYFHRCFHKVYQMSPLQYRKHYSSPHREHLPLFQRCSSLSL